MDSLQRKDGEDETCLLQKPRDIVLDQQQEGMAKIRNLTSNLGTMNKAIREYGTSDRGVLISFLPRLFSTGQYPHSSDGQFPPKPDWYGSLIADIR